MNEIPFSYEMMYTKIRFEKEAKGNMEMAYLHGFLYSVLVPGMRYRFSLLISVISFNITCENLVAHLDKI